MRLGWGVVIGAMLYVGGALHPGAGYASDDGQRLYFDYCSSCHGLSGKGDGPDAAVFAARPRNLREGFLQQYSTDDLVQRVRQGTPLELAFDLPALRTRAAEVETLVAHLKRLPTVDWDLARRGEEIFAYRCVRCHGWYGRPGPNLPAGVRTPRDLSNPAFQASVSEVELTTAVRHGRKGMPGLTPRVTVDEARLLVLFVRLLSPGFETYSQYCVNCHGDDGRGSGSMAEEVGRPRVVFDRDYFSRHDAEQLRIAVWHMLADAKPAMPHYRTVLSESQARAIVEYLRRAP